MDAMALSELQDVLDLPDVQVSAYERRVGWIRLHLSLPNRSAICSHCGVRSSRQHSERPILVRDLPCFGHNVELLVPRRRFACRHCEKPFTEVLPFVEFDTSFTRRYREYVFAQCCERTFSAVARQEGISDTVVRNIHGAFAAPYIQRRGRPAATRVLGIDEVASRKGNGHYVCIITDIERKRVIEVLPDRRKSTVISYFSALPASVRRSIRYVSIDMWEPYYEAVTEGLPRRVKIVVDRFHVMQKLNDVLTKCRRELQRTTESKEAREELKGLRWILVTNRENLSDEQAAKLHDLFKHCPMLRKCYRLKKDFRRIFEDERSRAVAQRKIQAWKKRARGVGLQGLEEFLRTLENWEDWILNYFSSGRITNGTVEGINNKIKLIKRRAYGYRNIDNFKQRIMVECHGP